MGIFAGTLTGLTPGIHINLLGAAIILAYTYFNFNPIYALTFIVSLSITHTFIDFIPSIILGCPDTDTELSLLPGHELLKNGRGYEAIILTAIGSLNAVFYSLIFCFPLIFIFQKGYFLIQNYIPFILIFTSFLLIFSEKEKFVALLVFILTGVLGLISNEITSGNSLLPMLSGLFGSSLLIKSIKEKPKIPSQKISKINFSSKKPLLSSLVISPFCSFLPGLGTGQAAVMSSLLFKQKRKEDFLVLVGATNTFVMIFSFFALYAIGKTRSGSSIVIKDLVGIPSQEILVLIILTIFFSGILSFFLTKGVSKMILKKIHKVNYPKISLITLIFLSLIILIFSKPKGFLVFILATFTGIYCINKKVRKTNMMGCLILPTIIWLLSG